jgi:fructan beta-fructosidase
VKQRLFFFLLAAVSLGMSRIAMASEPISEPIIMSDPKPTHLPTHLSTPIPLYNEPLRPQFHFSAKQGWLNDPNGLAYYNGQYHLFFQHCPHTWDGNAPKYWGNAVSRDLVHWEEVDEALAPDALGAMWSGSAVVDYHNTSGLGQEGKPPLVLIYTAAGEPFVQCLASSTDGRVFTKYPGNPVVKNITGGNRDPRVFWYAPTKHWVMTLWVEKDHRNTIHFLTSPNLRDWTLASVAEGGAGGDNFLYECPDMFELPLDGNAKNQKWVLTAANGEYAVGHFDGKTFTAETAKLPGERGKGFYAPQTFNDEPKGRRIQIGWFQTTTPEMPFNQSMSLPMELRLVTTPEGPRLTWTPVQELESLRAKSHKQGEFTLTVGEANPLAAIHSELVEIRAEFEPSADSETAFQVRGVPVVYEAKTQEIVVNGHRAPAPLHDGKQKLTIFADRTGLEVFAGSGLSFVPMPITLNPANTALGVAATSGSVQFDRLDVYELKSAWISHVAEKK